MLTTDDANALIAGTLPALSGMEFLAVEPGRVTARISVVPEAHGPNGFLHAAVVVLLADTACGFGTLASLPEGADTFATVELKTNFVATALEGTLLAEATLAHGGRTTQVWDASVTREQDGRVVALFRCTQLVLYARD